MDHSDKIVETAADCSEPHFWVFRDGDGIASPLRLSGNSSIGLLRPRRFFCFHAPRLPIRGGWDGDGKCGVHRELARRETEFLARGTRRRLVRLLSLVLGGLLVVTSLSSALLVANPARYVVGNSRHIPGVRQIYRL